MKAFRVQLSNCNPGFNNFFFYKNMKYGSGLVFWVSVNFKTFVKCIPNFNIPSFSTFFFKNMKFFSEF